MAEGMSCFELEGEMVKHYSEKFDSVMALAQLNFAPERMLILFRRWAEDLAGDPALERHRGG